MNKKILVGAGVAALAVVITAVGIITEKPYKAVRQGQCSITGADGTVIATVVYEDENAHIQCDYRDYSYADMVLKEAVDIITSKGNLTDEQAVKDMIKNNMIINTYYNSEYQNQVTQVIDNNSELTGNYSVVLNDISGHVLAVYSGSDDHNISDSYVNYAVTPTYAGSVIKPLSVYGPALEKGVIDWNTQIADEPYMQVEDQYGNRRMWPQNVVPYTYSDIYVTEGLAKSLNTIAINVLNKEGVSYAADFLSDEFGINVDYEKNEIAKGNTDKVLSAIGLGYLNAGVTVSDMAGCYQVFANGGVYVESHTISDIKKDGVDYYIDDKEQSKRQVFSPQTAYIMNRMMRGVVSEGGTAARAYVEGVDVAGKTGTTDNYENNWFVGVTPNLVCAVWNGYDSGVLNADDKQIQYIFRDIISGLHQKGLEYRVPDGVKKIQICDKTGLAATGRCESSHDGYFKLEDIVKECDE